MTMDTKKAEKIQRTYNNVRIALLVIITTAIFMAIYAN